MGVQNALTLAYNHQNTSCYAAQLHNRRHRQYAASLYVAAGCEPCTVSRKGFSSPRQLPVRRALQISDLRTRFYSAHGFGFSEQRRGCSTGNKKAHTYQASCPDGRLSQRYTPRGSSHFRQSYSVCIIRRRTVAVNFDSGRKPNHAQARKRRRTRWRYGDVCFAPVHPVIKKRSFNQIIFWAVPGGGARPFWAPFLWACR